jgi:hypothetical protein
MGQSQAAGRDKTGNRRRLAEKDLCAGLFVLRAAVVGGLFAVVAGGGLAAISRISQQPIVTDARPLARSASPVSMTQALASKPTTITARQFLDQDFSADEAAITWARRIPDDVLERDLADKEKADDILHLGVMRVRRGLVEAIVRAGRRTGVDPALLMAIADKESSFSATVKAQTSSATGLFQFIEKTWLRSVRKFGAFHGLEVEAAEIEGPDDRPFVADAGERLRILALRDDPRLSALIAAEMLKHDGGAIAKGIGRDLTVGETYLTHFLGPQDASRFLETVVDQPNAPAATLLPRPARANRPIFFARGKAKPLSVEAVHDKFEEMIGARVGRYAGVGDIAGATAFAE